MAVGSPPRRDACMHLMHCVLCRFIKLQHTLDREIERWEYRRANLDPLNVDTMAGNLRPVNTPVCQQLWMANASRPARPGSVYVGPEDPA